MTRREFAGALSAGLRGAGVPRLCVRPGPPSARAVVFTRAYAACPEPEAFRRSLTTGRFPHARAGPERIIIQSRCEAGGAILFISEPGGDSPLERSVRIDMALEHPRLRRGQASDFPVSTVDVVPTLYALEGLAIPDEVHGRNVFGERPESVYVEGGLGTANEWRMVVRGLDKLVVRPNLEVLHLFNLGEDSTEERNLAREAGNQLRVDELRALVRVWMKRTGDGMDPSGLKRR